MKVYGQSGISIVFATSGEEVKVLGRKIRGFYSLHRSYIPFKNVHPAVRFRYNKQFKYFVIFYPLARWHFGIPIAALSENESVYITYQPV